MADNFRLKGRSAGRPRRSIFVRNLRTIFFAIQISFLFGLVIGTFLRMDLDRPIRYMGDGGAESTAPAISVRATDPGDIGHALSRILVTRHYEEQVG
jgi:hypothetical protein